MNIYVKYLKKQVFLFLSAVFCVSCEAVCDLLGPTVMSKIINLGIEQKLMENITYYGGVMLLITAAGACFAVIRNIIASNVSQRAGLELRHDLFDKILRFSETSADALQSGSLITRMTNDTAQLVLFINGIMRIFLKAPITCVGSIVLASALNLRLSVIIYAVVAVVGVLIFISMKLSYPRFSKLQKAVDRVNSVVQEYIIGIRLVKAFGTYGEETNRFGLANTELKDKGVSSQMIVTVISPLLTLAVGCGVAIMLYAGGVLFEQRLANPGDITAFTIYMAQILSSLLMITNIFNVFVRTRASTTRIKEIIDAEPDASGGRTVGLKGAIRFNNVTFSYPGGSGEPAIKGLSFSINRGENLAIIGPTGSGKSTVVWLLLRFFDINGGSILLDGQNIKDLRIDSVRKNIATVFQKPGLFSGSVKENLLWGNQNASDKELDDVLRKSQSEFVYSMPESINSMLGSAGVNLSGGQKQRLSIARALVKNAPVLILDDATSALDAITEAKVLEALLSEKNRTLITVTQRCSVAMRADKILVLDNGVCMGFGNHGELLENCRMYKDIYISQIGQDTTI